MFYFDYPRIFIGVKRVGKKHIDISRHYTCVFLVPSNDIWRKILDLVLKGRRVVVDEQGLSEHLEPEHLVT